MARAAATTPGWAGRSGTTVASRPARAFMPSSREGGRRDAAAASPTGHSTHSASGHWLASAQ